MDGNRHRDMQKDRQRDRQSDRDRKKGMDRDRQKRDRDRYRHTEKKMRCCVKSQVMGLSYCPLTSDPGQWP